MSDPLAFTVYGTPVPKGSMRAYTFKRSDGGIGARADHDNKNTRAWSESIVTAALEVRGERMSLDGPVTLILRFFLPRPKSAPRRVVKQTKKPDLDKLVRCLKDGLTRAGVYRDDGQVVAVIARKDFAGGSFDPLGASGVPRTEVLVDEMRFDGVASTPTTTQVALPLGAASTGARPEMPKRIQHQRRKGWRPNA